MTSEERTGAGERTEEERERAREERERRRRERAQPQDAVLHAPPLPSSVEGNDIAAAVSFATDDPEAQTHTSTRVPDGLAGASGSSRPRRAHPRPHLPHPHLHRPHLPRRPDRHTRPASFAVMLAIAGLLAVLVAGAIVLATRSRPKASAGPQVVTVVVPEGKTAAQIAQIASSDGLRGDYLAAVRSAMTPTGSGRSPELRPSDYGAPARTHSLEGFLFPATYELYAGADVSQFVSEQLEAFRENFGSAEAARAKALGLTPYELLIVASMIEREAAIPRDRSLVAAVIYNRLRLNMALGVDATIRYALRDYTRPLTEAQLKSSSPYNTRTHRGLPPTPISNPGMASIQAASHPAKVSYLYYVAGADGCGDLIFSTTYAQFEHDAAAYREALRRNGGNTPTCKRR